MSERPNANRHLVSPKYFATLGIPILSGRDFDERDSSTVPHVAIVNQTFARQHFPGEDPVGRRLVTGMAQLPSQIVGVVADVRSTGLNTPPEADYFLPALQRPEIFTNILVRTNIGPAAMATTVREALRSVDPDLPLLQPQALTTRVAETMADRRLALVLLAGFAALALVIASLGVYSVMAHLVAYRTSEIGIRMALGASPHAVLRMVLGQGRRLTLLGVVLGIAGSVRRVPSDAAGAVRGEPRGAGRLRGGGGHAAARVGGRGVAARAARDADRPGDRAARGVSRLLQIVLVAVKATAVLEWTAPRDATDQAAGSPRANDSTNETRYSPAKILSSGASLR